MPNPITFARLTQIDPAEIAAHMSDPRVTAHLPLLTGPWGGPWDTAMAAGFVTQKEACWTRDGLGHWAFVDQGRYVGWGGFQKEEAEWDFGMVLTADAFGLGLRILRQAMDFAAADTRIPYVTFLLPPSRKNLGALDRMGARPIGSITHDGARFLKFRRETPGPV